ncbi:2-dehydro-3-deoxygalactonokinase [Luteimonas wenzhouensis]|uniref:2-dehydro-3-deoxygalactonokinase n=1 Tax=Luteimonas wenzhouensis TaxID=2599615 RepID=A0A5C5U1H3_9GAMM|nr:2-dehydro-3-deoxygalactonokinase [Luteimonas wenzhouensis]TWT19528.1 2-dehydro-3-deoxygalactonokinase [Luteimonas wenzhouensis]
MIAVDWGGTHLRLYRLDAAGAIVERRRSDQGAHASHGRHAEVLSALLAGWDDPDLVLCGMIGGRGGWQEVPYLDCPAGLDAIAAHLQRFAPPGFEGRRLWLVPGLRDGSGAVPDLMRGEESQLAALLERLPPGRHRACLPGTHSKWVTIRDGRIDRIHTAMTGELYGLLRRHSLVGALMPGDDEGFDGAAFDAGLARSAEASGLLHHLFGVRAAGLAGRYGDGLPSYLSGLLLGHELRGGLAFDGACPGPVHLVGSERLLAAYARALAALGVQVQRHPEDLAAHGLHALWTRRANPARGASPAAAG